jgi:hypothetical protein
MLTGGCCVSNVVLRDFVKERHGGKKFFKRNHFCGMINLLHNNRKHSGVAVFKNRNISL